MALGGNVVGGSGQQYGSVGKDEVERGAVEVGVGWAWA